MFLQIYEMQNNFLLFLENLTFVDLENTWLSSDGK